MSSQAKAQATFRDLADRLSKRFAGSSTIDTVRVTNDSAGWPMIILSDAANEAAGQPVIALRMRGIDMVSKDVFGNALTAYAPHKIEVSWELTAANNPIPADADIFVATIEASKPGVCMQLKELANGTAATAANMDAATASVEVEDLYWPTKGV